MWPSCCPMDREAGVATSFWTDSSREFDFSVVYVLPYRWGRWWRWQWQCGRGESSPVSSNGHPRRHNLKHSLDVISTGYSVDMGVGRGSGEAGEDYGEEAVDRAGNSILTIQLRAVSCFKFELLISQLLTVALKHQRFKWEHLLWLVLILPWYILKVAGFIMSLNSRNLGQVKQFRHNQY